MTTDLDIRFEQELKRLRSPAARVHETQEPCEDVLGSFIGGHPYLEAEREWPVCCFCHRPMSFTVQLHARDHGIILPERLTLLSLFVCNHEDCKRRCSLSYAEHGENFRVYAYANPAPSKHRARSIPAGQPEKVRRRLRFEEGWSLPDWTIVEARDPLGILARWQAEGVTNPGSRYARVSRKVCPVPIDDAFKRFVGGWPAWTNLSDKTPLCAGEPMLHLFQVWDSLGGIRFYEQASLFYCPLHPSDDEFELVFDYT
ncbi:DUF1963 domain-containing protein [Vitiosangium sp. GDMCC 1.1324]|uniref:DUF1963 domain-containing protein n=1 Tax=Vitiosangium sp. (strain GDMCC 1.1324) TaxID=2138576 RepID=UPI00130D5EFD|nr:DUF1963 domain-containing protein [Vitiosangium sp. GDMCC 1.1324]